MGLFVFLLQFDVFSVLLLQKLPLLLAAAVFSENKNKLHTWLLCLLLMDACMLLNPSVAVSFVKIALYLGDPACFPAKTLPGVNWGIISKSV